jgi:hypothetical protein
MARLSTSTCRLHTIHTPTRLTKNAWRPGSHMKADHGSVQVSSHRYSSLTARHRRHTSRPKFKIKNNAPYGFIFHHAKVWGFGRYDQNLSGRDEVGPLWGIACTSETWTNVGIQHMRQACISFYRGYSTFLDYTVAFGGPTSYITHDSTILCLLKPFRKIARVSTPLTRAWTNFYPPGVKYYRLGFWEV